jgi:hypothetical protein
MSDSDLEQTFTESDMSNDEYFESPVTEIIGSQVLFSPLCVATTTCLHKYAIVRMDFAEKELLSWPPLMLVVLSYLNNRYERRELVTERNIAMLELLLKVPIQLSIKRGDMILDLNKDETLDFTNVSFTQSLEILNDLVKKDVVKEEEIRIPIETLSRY